MKRLAALSLAALLLALVALPGCISAGGIYGGGPGRRPLPPPCFETIRGEWLLEAQDGEQGSAPPAPVHAGVPRLIITDKDIQQVAPARYLGHYRIAGAAHLAVDLEVNHPTPLHIVCNHPDKIEIREADAPGSRVWFYRRVAR
jgi:hypothetical protein